MEHLDLKDRLDFQDLELSLVSLEYLEPRAREVYQDSWVSLDSLDAPGALVFRAGRVSLVTPEEMDFQEDLDSPDRKVKEVTLAVPDLLALLPHRDLWRRETMATLVSVVYQASPDPEVTKVFPGCLVVKVFPDFLVLPSRVKASPECLVSLVSRDPQATPDRRERPESTGSLASLDQVEMMVLLVCLVIPESLADLVLKVFLESRMDIQEVLVLKASSEIQASQEGVGSMVLVEMMASQEVQDILDQRVHQVNPDDQE